MLDLVYIPLLIIAAIGIYVVGRSHGYRSGMGRGQKVADMAISLADGLSNIVSGDVIQEIQQANPDRKHETLPRRFIKLMEELGEASEAYLNITSKSNPKKLTWADVREELVDVVIVAVDLALTPLPHNEHMSAEELEQDFISEVRRKLAKWRRNRDTSQTASDG